MQNVYELYRSGLLTTMTIKDIPSNGMIQVSIIRNLKDENGKEVINSNLEMYFTAREFKEFFQPMVNDMKVRFDEYGNSQPNA